MSFVFIIGLASTRTKEGSHSQHQSEINILTGSRWVGSGDVFLDLHESKNKMFYIKYYEVESSIIACNVIDKY